MAITPQHATAPAPGGFFGQQTALNCEPSDPFILMAHPGAAQVATDGLDGPTWLPVLTPLYITPGVNLVEIKRKGDTNEDMFRNALAHARAKGFAPIDPTTQVADSEHLPAGVAPGPYMRAYPTFDRRTQLEGTLYKEAWYTRMASRSPTDPPRWKFDRAAYNRWVVSLLEAGVIPGPDEFAREEFLSHARSWAQRQHNIDDPAKRADRVKGEADHVAKLEGARVVDPNSPKPSGKSRGKRASA